MIVKLLNNETIRFVICAVIYNLFSMSINWSLLHLGVPYLVCATAGYVGGVLVAYLLNTKFVFKKTYTFANFIKFISVYVSNYFITMFLTWFLVSILKINPYLAPLICIAFGFVYNYTMSKLFVYRKKK